MADASTNHPVILERYRLVRQLGEGGMGAVYEAHHIHLDSKHAVKAMRVAGGYTPDQLEQLNARFLREAKICGMVKHPNLVPVTDFGTTDGVPYIVMDFIDGKDLQGILDSQGAIPEEESLKIIRDVAAALAALHEKGIIHRDMKPANVMIEKDSGRVVLTDLGIAKDSSSSANLTQGIMGTPAFMAPEQVADTKEAGPDSDVYSLGATLYTLIKGKPPFEGESALSVIQAAQQNLFAFSSIAGVARERDNQPFAADVEKLLHDMTTYERKERIKDMKKVVDGITQILAGRTGGGGQGDGITMPFGVEDLGPAPGGQGPATAGTVSRPPTGMGPQQQSGGPPTGGTVQQAQQPQRPPTQAPQPMQPSQPPAQQSSIAMLPDDDAPAGDGRKGMVAVVALIVVALAGGGVFLAANQGVIDISGISPASDAEGDGKTDGGTDANAAGQAEDQDGGQDSGQAGTATAPKDPVEPGPEYLDVATAPKEISIPVVEGLALQAVLVKPGTFTIGTQGGDNVSEQPAKKIEITYPYYIGKYEVTVAQYAAYLNERPPRKTALATMDLDVMGLDHADGKFTPKEGAERVPARGMTHLAARRFGEWLSEKAGVEVTLPNEVEWEYAARGPESRVYPWGNDWEAGIACADQSKKKPEEVGTYVDCVSWCGAFDMSGNVFEWTTDKYVRARYGDIEAKDPKTVDGKSSSGFRVIRGGCYSNDDYVCRAMTRMGMKASEWEAAVGLRVKVVATKDVLKYGGEKAE